MEETVYTEIYRFLNGEMNETERDAFEQRLQQEPDLAKETDFHRDLLKGVRLYGDRQLQNRIQQTEEEAKKKGFLFTDQHIILYLNDELPEELIEIFEQRMATDEAFVQEVAFQQDLVSSVDLLGDRRLQENIQATDANLQASGFFEQLKSESSEKKEVAPKTKVVSLFSRRTLAIAASFLLLFSAGYFLLRPAGSYPGLYTAYFQSDSEALENEIGNLSALGMAIPDKARRESLKTALDLYQSQDFKTACQMLTDHLQQYPGDAGALYFQGLSLMESNKFKRAASAFGQLLDLPGAAYQSGALWYQGLSYLQLRGKKAEARAIFEELAADAASSYSSQAKAILEEL